MTELTGYGYDDVVKSWGYDILAAEAFGSYQGDLVYLLQDGDKYGWSVVGYGSCSGCDEWEALEQDDNGEPLPAAVQELSTRLKGEVRWKSLPDMREWLAADKQETDWSWYEEGYKEFVQKVLDEKLPKL